MLESSSHCHIVITININGYSTEQVAHTHIPLTSAQFSCRINIERRLNGNVTWDVQREKTHQNKTKTGQIKAFQDDGRESEDWIWTFNGGFDDFCATSFYSIHY